MTRPEVLSALATGKSVLCRMRRPGAAGEFEDVELRIAAGMTAADAMAYAALLLPPGHRGRVTLTIRSPESARARALLVGLLRALDPRT